MATTLKVRKIGNSLGVLLPQSVLDGLRVGAGDELHVVSTSDGIRLTPYDPDFAATLADAQAFMDSHRNAFRELAK